MKATAIWHARMSEDTVEKQRRAGYAYKLTVESPAAKEVRLFGLADWIVGGFTSLRRQLLDRSWAERKMGARPTAYAVLIVTAANVLFFWSLARDATDGRVSLGSLVVFAQAAIGASTLAFGEWDWWLRTSAQPVPLVLGLLDRMGPAGALAPARATRRACRNERYDSRMFGSRIRPAAASCSTGSISRSPRGSRSRSSGRTARGRPRSRSCCAACTTRPDGTISVDGVDLRELDIASWRSRIAAVFQDYVRYELTLRDNVAPAGASDEDVLAALDQARAADLAGLDTVLSRAYERRP